jgi:hypothetical protein
VFDQRILCVVNLPQSLPGCEPESNALPLGHGAFDKFLK